MLMLMLMLYITLLCPALLYQHPFTQRLRITTTNPFLVSLFTLTHHWTQLRRSLARVVTCRDFSFSRKSLIAPTVPNITFAVSCVVVLPDMADLPTPPERLLLASRSRLVVVLA
ncbi:unnamed protein product [Ceratitis capitata]|uniref:(Mediterranean fruit fly) hypothetical protein n=1 Tax=Ceratitis capitata TaxID=7213 RepID=A0A811U637_CERCA|nr:unnamed protein product [Ceratitis capitata]